MKKIIFPLLIVLAFFINLHAKNYKISYDPDYAPFTYSINGEAYGILVDIVKLWAKENKHTIKFIDANTWDNGLSLVKNKEVDFFLGTDQFENWMYGTNVIFKTKASLFTLKSNTKKIGKIGIVGEDYKEILKDNFKKKNLEISLYDDYDELSYALTNKEVDFIFDDKLAMETYILQNRLNHLIEKIDNLDIYSNIKLISYSKKIVEQFNEEFEKLPKNKLINIENNWVSNNDDKFYSFNFEEFLNSSEKLWLENNPISRLGIMSYWPSDMNGNSLHTEVLKLINKYSGLNLVPIKYNTWSKGFNAAKEGEELHGIMGLSWSKDREEFFTYSPAYDFTPSYLITKKSNDKIKSFKDLEDKTLYLKTNSITHKMMAKKSPNTKIIDVDTVESMYEKLALDDEADAMLAYFIDKEAVEENGLKVVEAIYDRYGEVAIGINEKYEVLSNIILKAFKVIPKNELSAIRDKDWSDTKTKSLYALSRKEKKYLEDKGSLNICVNPNWEPIEFVENNKPKGVSIDILHILKDKLQGIKYNFIQTNSWSESQSYLKEKKCDILPTAIKTEKRSKDAYFTEPYLNYDLAIVTRVDKPLVSNFETITSKTMSRNEGSGLITLLKEKYPYIKIVESNGYKESFEDVLYNKVYFTISTIPVFSYYKNKYGLKELQVAGYTDMKYNLSIAVRDDDKTLLKIFNKVLKTIPESTYGVVHEKWANTKVIKQTDWITILEIIGVISLVVLFLIYNNSKLNRKVKNKTEDLVKQKTELEILISSFDKNVIFTRMDLDGKIIHASNAFCKLSGYRFKELIGKTHEFFKHEDNPKHIFDEILYRLNHNSAWKGEIKLIHKDKSFYWVHANFEPDFNVDGELIGYKAIMQEVTDKKAVEDLSRNLELKVEERTKEIEVQKEQIEIILENILLPVLITSKKDRTILYANKYAEIQYETSVEDLVGSSIDKVYTTKDQKEAILGQMEEKGYVENLEQHYKTFSGKEFIGLLSVKPIKYEKQEAFIGMVTDITHQKEIEEEIRQIHKHTRDSIEYASLIQHSIIPDNELFRKYFNDYLAIWHPKDIVGGDIYLFEELRENNECLLMVIDCTGHGVPGAFVTMLVKAIERQIIAKINHNIDEDVSPANLLGVFNRSMKHLLKQDGADSISNAGFDGGIIYYNKEKKILKFSGAETPLFYVEDGELKTIKGSRHSVGYKKSDGDFKFKEHVIDVKEGMQFYLTTDGYIDQNGGHKGFPFGKKRFGKIIQEYHKESFADQQEVFLEELHAYQGEEDRNDDVTLIGIKI